LTSLYRNKSTNLLNPPIISLYNNNTPLNSNFAKIFPQKYSHKNIPTKIPHTKPVKMSHGPIQRKAVMALLREKRNAEHCHLEANSYTGCLAMSNYNHTQCMPLKRALDFCMMVAPGHDRTFFRMRRSSFVQDLLRTSRRISATAKR
jgi:hypothetical protein